VVFWHPAATQIAKARSRGRDIDVSGARDASPERL
jgi:hypothetical protein